MKKLIAAIAILAVVLVTQAQTNTSSPSISGGITEIYSAIQSSGLTTATNYAIEPYFTYAPSLPSKVGGGVLAVFNVDKYIGAGLGVDYLGQFSLVSANVTLKVPLHPFQSITSFSGALTNVAIVPFALTGVGTAMSGTASGLSTIQDAGAYISFGHALGGQFNTGFCYGQWGNAGAYSGTRYHVFLGWSKGF